MASPSSPSPGVFESRVLASRCISCKQEIELLADLAGCRTSSPIELLDVAAQPRQLLADVGALGQQRRLLRQPRRIHGRAAEQLLEARFSRCAYSGRLRSASSSTSAVLAPMLATSRRISRPERAAFGSAHLLQPLQGLRRRTPSLARPIAPALLRASRPAAPAAAGGRPRRASAAARTRSGSGARRKLAPQLLDGTQIGAGDLAIHVHRGALHGLDVQRHFHVAAAKPIAHQLADLRLERLEALRAGARANRENDDSRCARSRATASRPARRAPARIRSST